MGACHAELLISLNKFIGASQIPYQFMVFIGGIFGSFQPALDYYYHEEYIITAYARIVYHLSWKF